VASDCNDPDEMARYVVDPIRPDSVKPALMDEAQWSLTKGLNVFVGQHEDVIRRTTNALVTLNKGTGMTGQGREHDWGSLLEATSNMADGAAARRAYVYYAVMAAAHSMVDKWDYFAYNFCVDRPQLKKDMDAVEEELGDAEPAGKQQILLHSEAAGRIRAAITEQFNTAIGGMNRTVESVGERPLKDVLDALVPFYRDAAPRVPVPLNQYYFMLKKIPDDLRQPQQGSGGGGGAGQVQQQRPQGDAAAVVAAADAAADAAAAVAAAAAAAASAGQSDDDADADDDADDNDDTRSVSNYARRLVTDSKAKVVRRSRRTQGKGPLDKRRFRGGKDEKDRAEEDKPARKKPARKHISRFQIKPVTLRKR